MMASFRLKHSMEVSITVATTVLPHENPNRVVDSVRALFPQWNCDEIPEVQDFPSKRDAVRLVGQAQTLNVIIEGATKQRILDTALDAMTLDLDGDSTTFSLSRQAALANKISFVVDERPIGGNIDVTLTGNDLSLWLEQETWHDGRHYVPRRVGDELSMNSDGNPREWFDKHGRKTMTDMNGEED